MQDGRPSETDRLRITSQKGPWNGPGSPVPHFHRQAEDLTMMLHVLLITVRSDHLDSFTAGLLADSEISLEQVSSATEALDIVRNRCPDLVVLDSALPGADSLELVRRMIVVNAMVNTAVISPLSDDDFHEKSEGLGILCRLPPAPTVDDSKILLKKLRGII